MKLVLILFVISWAVEYFSRNYIKNNIEEKLKWTKEEVINNITVQIFYDNDLGGLLSKYCGNSPLKALQIAYPGEYTNLKHERIS